MRASHYAQAISELLAEHPASEHARLLKRFGEVLRARGGSHLASRILRSLAKKDVRAATLCTVTIMTAHEISEEQAHAILKEHHIPFDAHAHLLERRVDPTLTGGAVVRTHALRVDASHKRSLRDLYQKLISR